MSTEAWLFSYGTLRQSNVQHALFGRQVERIDDVLTGFELDIITITDAAVIETSGTDRHPILKRAAADRRIEGAALLLSAAELEAVDRYEADDYVRVPVKLASGRDAFAYVQREAAAMDGQAATCGHLPTLSRQPHLPDPGMPATKT